MSQVLFINSPQNCHNKRSTALYPSGALVLMATMCKEHGHFVKIFDGAVDNTDIKRVLADFKPDYVCITVNTFQTKHAKVYLKEIKKFDSRITTVIGGPHISAIKNNALVDFPYADIAVMGEGEFTVLDIVNGMDLANIKGIYCNGVLPNIWNSPRPYASDLDHIPLPDLSLVDLSKYIGVTGNGKLSMFIMASRGCPFKCTYCNKSVFGTSTRFRKSDKIIEEIKHLHDEYSITHIYFQDDTFNLNRQWITEILNKIIDNELTDIEYMAPCRANEKLVDKKLLDLMKRANFTTIFYGVESGNQNMLNSMKKGLNKNEIRRAFKLTRDAGINITAAFMLGLPGETHSTIKDTIDFWKELKPDYSGFTIATPFPGTVFDDYVTENGYKLNSDWDTYKQGGNYVKTDELSNTQLEYYSNIMIFGQGNLWIYKLPVYAIAKSSLLCGIAVVFMGLYKKYNMWRVGE